MLQKIDQRLQRWANWYQRNQSGALGYPSTSVFTQLPTDKNRLPNPCIPSNPEAEAIEAWVVQLHQCKPALATVLRAHYLEGGLMPQKARGQGMSLSQYKLSLNLARYWLAGKWHEHHIKGTTDQDAI